MGSGELFAQKRRQRLTYQRVCIEVLVAVPTSKEESLLDTGCRREAIVESDRPTVSMELLWLDACLEIELMYLYDMK